MFYKKVKRSINFEFIKGLMLWLGLKSLTRGLTLYAFKNYIWRGQAWRKNKLDRPTLRPLFVFNMYYARQICLLTATQQCACVRECVFRWAVMLLLLFLYLIKMQIRPLVYKFVRLLARLVVNFLLCPGDED